MELPQPANRQEREMTVQQAGWCCLVPNSAMMPWSALMISWCDCFGAQGAATLFAHFLLACCSFTHINRHVCHRHCSVPSWKPPCTRHGRNDSNRIQFQWQLYQTSWYMFTWEEILWMENPSGGVSPLCQRLDREPEQTVGTNGYHYASFWSFTKCGKWTCRIT